MEDVRKLLLVLIFDVGVVWLLVDMDLEFVRFVVLGVFVDVKFGWVLRVLGIFD